MDDTSRSMLSGLLSSGSGMLQQGADDDAKAKRIAELNEAVQELHALVMLHGGGAVQHKLLSKDEVMQVLELCCSLLWVSSLLGKLCCSLLCVSSLLGNAMRYRIAILSLLAHSIGTR